MWVCSSSIYPHAQVCSSAQRGQQAKEGIREWWGPSLSSRTSLLLEWGVDSESALLNPFDTLSWPQNPGQICWHLDVAQTGNRLVSVTASQNHIMSQWTMVTSLKHPDMCSAIMQPNQCLWGDERFQCNHSLWAEKANGQHQQTHQLAARGWGAGTSHWSCCPASCLSGFPNCLLLRRVWLTHFFFFLITQHLFPTPFSFMSLLCSSWES